MTFIEMFAMIMAIFVLIIVVLVLLVVILCHFFFTDIGIGKSEYGFSKEHGIAKKTDDSQQQERGDDA